MLINQFWWASYNNQNRNKKRNQVEQNELFNEVEQLVHYVNKYLFNILLKYSWVASYIITVHLIFDSKFDSAYTNTQH